jgi:Lrp/AsnC family leucine-responsive transcriptional regulator
MPAASGLRKKRAHRRRIYADPVSTVERRPALVDDIDRRILEILRRNARAPVTEIARMVGLSTAPVSRRIERMEINGTIRGYTALLDEQRTGTLVAFTEIRLAGSTETGTVEQIVREIPEVQAFYTIAGDPDALLRIRVEDVDHLQRVVNALRRTGKLAGTKTLIVLHAWERTPK